MGQRRWIALYRLVFAAAALIAIGYQIWYLADRDIFRPANFFSFFTIQSNLFATAVLLYGAFADRDEVRTQRHELIRGTATLYMATTGIVYGLLLSGYSEALQTQLVWVDTVVHKVMPLVMVADWLIDPPRVAIPFRRALVWLVYPLAYCAYSLIRGPIVDWYPYPFLNPDEAGGYAAVAAYCVGIALGILVFAWLVVQVGRRARLAWDTA